MSDTSSTPRSARRPLLLVLLLVLAGLAGCASVPESSPVQVLRRVGDGDAPVLPPGPAEGSNALDLVRGFVYASGSSPDRHGAARRFLAPEAADWDDGTGVTVLAEQFDTVYPTSVDPEADMRTVRIRGTALGKLTPGGWFEASQAPVQIDVNVVRRDGQWRIARLPGGVLVRMSDFRVNYRTVQDLVRRSRAPGRRAGPALPAEHAGAGTGGAGDGAAVRRAVGGTAGRGRRACSSRTRSCGRTSPRAPRVR